jgi:hypothetical protein
MTWKCTFKVHPGGPDFWPEPNISRVIGDVAFCPLLFVYLAALGMHFMDGNGLMAKYLERKLHWFILHLAHVCQIYFTREFC